MQENDKTDANISEKGETPIPRRIREEKRGFLEGLRAKKQGFGLDPQAVKSIFPYAMLSGGLITGFIISMFIPLNGGGFGENETFSQAAEVNAGDIEFAPIAYPDGWKSDQSDADVSKASKQNPFPGLSNSCTFTPSMVFLPEEKLGLGADYLSKELLIDVTSEHSKASIPVKSSISLNSKPVTAWERQGDKTLTVVRVFDGEVYKVPKGFKDSPPRGLETMTDSGIPAVVMNYSCQDAKDVNLDVAHSLVNAANVVSTSADN